MHGKSVIFGSFKIVCLMVLCALMSGVQTQNCYDTNRYCSRYEAAGLCDTDNPNVMMFLQQNCRKTCDLCVDNVLWSAWGEFGPCNVTCGEGTQMRTRTCLGGSETAMCEGSGVELQSCSEDPCPEPNWSNWGEYGDCDVTCGGGQQSRMRTCMYESESESCEGSAEETQYCNEFPCPTPWSSWTDCSLDCGVGYQTRMRTCETSDCDYYDHEECVNVNDCVCTSCECENDPEYARYCNDRVRPDRDRWCGGRTLETCRKTCGECDECIEDCDTDYNEWSEWTDCSLTCGGGIRFRFRDCNYVSGCEGEYYESEVCNSENCGYSDWYDITMCNETCGGGYLEQQRDCLLDCEEDFQTRMVECNTEECPAEYTDWYNVTSCNATCGGGYLMEERDCLSGCEADQMRLVECNTEECIAEYTDWFNVTSCNATCGGGYLMEERDCLSGCEADQMRLVECNTEECPVFSDWYVAVPCHKTCGMGIAIEQRDCLDPTRCSEDESRGVDCNLGECTPGAAS